jgi:hypothetical protein
MAFAHIPFLSLLDAGYCRYGPLTLACDDWEVLCHDMNSFHAVTG